jgi:octaprenyl-diphosphate synthase
MSTFFHQTPNMSLSDISKPVQHHLNRFNDYFKEQMSSNVTLLDTIIRYILKSKGKQVRPALVFLSAELCGGINERTFVGASMVELLHTATLVHDDVVDSANERRGLASINAVWKNKVAVLVGDYLLSRGLLTAVENNEFDFLKITSTAVRRMSEGELLQIQKSRQKEMDEATYYKIIGDKTASLISTCCEIGAVSASHDSDIRTALRTYGENVGLAFQIQDDILDYTSRTTILGKPIGNDIKEGKITLPLITACTNADAHESKKIISLVKSKKVSQKEIDYVQSFVREHKGIERAQAQAQMKVDTALSALARFDDSIAKQTLTSFAGFVISRES